MAVKKKKKSGNVRLVEQIRNEINVTMGKPVLKLGSDEMFRPVKISSGSLAIDRITGGGFTLGRHVELYGDESAGKSFTVLRTMALAQQRGGICALVDPEKVFEAEWFRHLGGNPDELLLFQPEKEWNAEDAIGVMMLLADLMEEHFIEVIGIDSVAAMVPQEEMKKDPREEDRMAGQARMMSRALRRLTTINKRTLFLWTNQERMNIGFGSQFNPRMQSGGRALRYYATTRLEFRKTGKVDEPTWIAEKGELKKKKGVWGNWIQIRSEKDKSTRPHRQGSYIFDNKRGRIDAASEILHLALEDEIVEKKGNRYIYEDMVGDEWKGTQAQWRKMLIENPDLHEELRAAVEDMTAELSRVTDSDEIQEDEDDGED